MRALLLCSIIACTSACGGFGFPGVYRLDIEQGNIVTEDMADQLQPGMTRRQVRFILGTPLIEDTFNPDRWDYLFVKRNGQTVLTQTLLSVEFEGDRLVALSGNLMPASWGGN